MTCRSPKESQGWQNCRPADSKGHNVRQGSNGDCHSGMLEKMKYIYMYTQVLDNYFKIPGNIEDNLTSFFKNVETF